MTATGPSAPRLALGRVVGGRDHPAPYGCDAEHVEEPAADVRAVHGVALAARRQVEALAGPRERPVEQLALACPDFLQIG